MYSEWSSIPLEVGDKGVLDVVGGKEVVLAVVKQLASNEPSPLKTDAEVEWVLEVVRYGLSLPLSEHDAIRECVRICCGWLAPLLPPAPAAHPPPPAVPQPVLQNPKQYAVKILKHLYNLFVPRPNESGDAVGKQAVLCHRVLRVCAALGAADSSLHPLGTDGWRALLLLQVSAADALLAPPAAPSAAPADQLCDRVLAVLFQLWILASHRCFPSPPLWRTLRGVCLRWRHRPALTAQWTRASLALTRRMRKLYYPNMVPVGAPSEEDDALIPAEMSCEAVTQTWYRILHTIGNPVDLCKPHVICQTPHLLQYSLTQEEGNRDWWQHPSLQTLPAIFHMAMRGVAAHVDVFLGGAGSVTFDMVGGTMGEEGGEGEGTRRSLSISARNKDKHDKGAPRASLISLPGSSRPISVAPTTPPNSIISQAGDYERPPLPAIRPTVNSLLHLFGEWLFEASLIGTMPLQQLPRGEGTPPPPIMSDAQYRLNMMSFQPGRAEAIGALCRVLTARRRGAGEALHAPHRARAYAALRTALRDPAAPAAAAVVANAPDMFRVDLEGVLILAADVVVVLELILGSRTPRLACGDVDPGRLRAAAASLLLSLVAAPYHYRDLPMPEFPGSNEFAGVSLGGWVRARLAALCLRVWGGGGSAPPPAPAAPLLSALYLTALHVVHTPPPTPPPQHPHQHPPYRGRSEGAGSVGANSLDDLTADVATTDLDPNDPNFGEALVVRATSLVCHRLITSWKNDLQVSLAALEILSGLAKLHPNKPDASDRARAVHWICEYISSACARPPPAHSRDLHSCVVAAYASLAAWLCPALLRRRATLATLLEVVELGLTGTKSQGKPGEPPKMKDEKEIKPVSMRVRDAAEALLMLILEMTEGTGERCRLDERRLNELGHSNIRHYVLDGNILLSLLEEPLANSQEPQPTLCVIVRAGWGRAAWALSTRGWARGAPRPAPAAPRPLAMPAPRDPATHPAPAPPARPPSPPAHHNNLEESAFPTAARVLRRLADGEAPALFRLLDQQAALEAKARPNDGDEDTMPEECVPPEPVTEFQTARLFLSNFGFLNIVDRKEAGRVVSLRAGPGLGAMLRRVDAAGARLALTAHVFCVRAARPAARHVLAAAASPAPPPAFVQLLRGLGTPVRVAGHPGWTGHVDTSYDAPFKPTEPIKRDNITPSIYDGREQVLYWSDATAEIAFVVPSEASLASEDSLSDCNKSDVDGGCMSSRTDKSAGSNWDVSSTSSGQPSYERSTSESDKGDKRSGLSDKMRAMSLDLDKHPTSGAMGSGRRVRDYTTKILIIWMEDDEDIPDVSIDELLPYCGTGQPYRRHEVRVVWLGARRSGLVVVGGAGAGGGPGAGGAGAGGAQLAAGAALSPRLLPRCLVPALLELHRRTTLPTDHYQPPHVRRRHLIQELAQQYKEDLTEPELLESLFRPPAAC